MPSSRFRSWDRAFDTLSRPVKRLLNISDRRDDWVSECLAASPSAAHDAEIEKYFRTKTQSGASAPATSPALSVFICFTQRSGSTRLGELLTSTGKLPRSRGDFSWRSVVTRSDKHGINSLEQYADHLIEAQSEHGVFICKTSAPQLSMLTQRNLIPRLFTAPRFIFLRRRDLLGQAISFGIAAQTGNWNTRKGFDSPEPKYNPAVLASRIRSITAANAWFQEYFALFGLPVFDVVYEDFVADEAGTVSAITEWLGLGPSQIDLGKTDLQPQRNALNAEWRKRFIAESRLRLDAGSAPLWDAQSHQQ